MKSDTLITIIIPIYNTEKYLKRCIESTLQQTYANLEIILVNDGSTDNSDNICKQYAKVDKRIKYYYKKNGGLSDARNFGLSKANGEYIGFIDSDDWIAPDMYEYLYSLIKKNQVEVASIKMMVTDREKMIKKTPEHITVHQGNSEILDQIISSENFSFCNKLISKSILKAKINVFEVGKCNEDIIASCNIYRKEDAMVVSNQVKYFYYSSASHTSISNPVNGLRKSDLDLLYATDYLLDKTRETQNENLIKLAKIKKARSYFSLLLKIAMYGFYDKNLEDNRQKIIDYLVTNLKKNLILLLKSNIDFKRKIACLCLASSFTMSRLFFKVLKKYV